MLIYLPTYVLLVIMGHFKVNSDTDLDINYIVYCTFKEHSYEFCISNFSELKPFNLVVLNKCIFLIMFCEEK